MKLNYDGRHEPFSAEENKLLTSHVQGISRMIDRKSEREAHVIFSGQRHIRSAEITMNYYGHAAVAKASAPSHFNALLQAMAKLEKQLHKIRNKWLDHRRDTKPAPPAEKAVTPRVGPKAAKVLRPSVRRAEKPLSSAEAAALIAPNTRYFVFQDVDAGGYSLLVRREDGRLELIETVAS
jgi:ribosomal subunit interface protein